MEGEQEKWTLQEAVTKTHCTAFLSDRIDLRLPGSLCPAPLFPSLLSLRYQRLLGHGTLLSPQLSD